jgi:DNA-binding winged helix-turn-helix (wHTH) protein
MNARHGLRGHAARVARPVGARDSVPVDPDSIAETPVDSSNADAPARRIHPTPGADTEHLRDDPRPESLRVANVELRPSEYQALIDGNRVALTVREFEVLLILAERPDRVVHRAHIYEAVWGGEMRYRERAIDVFVRKIRGKLGEVAPSWVYIHTHFGIGDRFAPEERHHGASPEEVPPARRPRRR